MSLFNPDSLDRRRISEPDWQLNEPQYQCNIYLAAAHRAVG
jgi:hypothetical protein